ncbi:hypothetical protein OVA14_05500 [Agrococcus sp. SL85]|uniref:hypothetical protein n=1 Tax=Agrococcus sp. SL85 TaxID=2995141 RepID=UPI00226D38C2|nr:hypothetical protein [Agrococcus sp. SL85]WAC67198.1 hypothetical protein OVA14_05500 [Agrococcus sp. SL85]
MRAGTGRRMAALTTMVTTIAVLAACAPTEDPAEAPTAPRTSSAPTAGAGPDPSAAPTPTVAPQVPVVTPPAASSGAAEPLPLDRVVESQDGAVRLHVPSSWPVTDSSWLQTGRETPSDWINNLFAVAEDGELHISYQEGPDYGSGAWEGETWGIVDRIDAGGGLEAVAWWSRHGDGLLQPQLTLGPAVAQGERPVRAVPFGEQVRHLAAMFSAHHDIETVEEAEQVLHGEQAQTALAILATAELRDLPAQTFPASMLETVDGEQMLRYTTKNGSSSFLVPLDWTIEDHSHEFTQGDGRTRWENSVWLYDDRDYPQMYYSDYLRWDESHRDQPGWRLGEARETADGWRAAMWSHDSGTWEWEHTLGVYLADAGNDEPHLSSACRGDFCRSFWGEGTDREYGVVDPDEWFAGERATTMLTLVASLEAHHDDFYRMP